MFKKSLLHVPYIELKYQRQFIILLVHYLACNANKGLNDICTPENTFLELKGSDGKSYYANCTDSFHYPLCVEDRCQCVYWKVGLMIITSGLFKFVDVVGTAVHVINVPNK